jgi:ferric-dicitrate binding protein FerR (iron transport regulator)
MNPNSDDMHALIAKFLTAQLSEAEATVLEEWKSACKENLREYNDFISLWAKSGELKMSEPIDFAQAQNSIRIKTGLFSSRKRWIGWVIQAAAVLVLSLIFSGVYSYWNSNDSDRNLANNLSAPVFQEIKAAFGTQTKIELADGTKVFLNSGSKLLFPQTFINQKQRVVSLEGEGYFEVAKNKEQPFIVKANQLNIKVQGTKFNVDAYDDNLSVSVALVEGSVMLQDNSGKENKDLMQLSPNQVATLDAASQTLTKTDVTDLNKYTAWINGRIVFFGDPIQTVVKKLSKWYNVDIVISDKKLEGYKFTGTFINEPVEQVLNVLSMTSQMAYIVEPVVKQSDNIISKRKIILKSKI